MPCILNCIKFQIGFACNLACPFCLVQANDRGPKLEPTTVTNALKDDILRKQLKRIVITGGEPTFHPYLPITCHIINVAKHLGVESTIYTNGTYLDDRMLDLLKVMGLTEIRLSLYPENTPFKSDILSRLDKHGFNRFLKYTVTRENYKGLKDILALVETAQPHRFQIKPFNQTGIKEVDEKFEMHPDQVLEMAGILLEYRRKATFRVDLLPLCYEFLVAEVPVERIAKCNCGKGSEGYLVLDPLGNVYPCGAYKENLGNVNDPGTALTQVWVKSKLLERIRAAEVTPPDECKECKHFNVCRLNDCHSTTFNYYGNFSRGNPQCPILARKRFA